MAGPVGKIGWKVVGMAFSIPTGIAVRKAVDNAWRRSRGSEPPKDPRRLDHDWVEVLLWAAASGTATAFAKVIATRGAAATYRAVVGLEPPKPKDSA